MIRVVKHGQKRVIVNPRNPKEETVEIPVTFIEEGRGGLNANLTQSSELLSEWAGANVGLNLSRTHTFPVRENQIEKFAIDTELPFFINRTLTSTKQMRQQENVEGRMIDGKLTYVSTTLSRTAEPDKDLRVSLETSAAIDPERVRRATTGTADVYFAEEQQQGAETPQGANIQHETLTQ